MYLLLLALFPLLPLQHRFTGRKRFSWKAVALLYILRWREGNYREGKEKNRRWKSQSCTITASCVPAPLLNCTSTNTILAWHWTFLFISERGQVSRNIIWKPIETVKVHTQYWTVLSMLAKCRNTTPYPAYTHIYPRVRNKLLKIISKLAAHIFSGSRRSHILSLKQLDLTSGLCIFFMHSSTKLLA